MALLVCHLGGVQNPEMLLRGSLTENRKLESSGTSRRRGESMRGSWFSLSLRGYGGPPPGNVLKQMSPITHFKPF